MPHFVELSCRVYISCWILHSILLPHSLHRNDRDNEGEKSEGNREQNEDLESEGRFSKFVMDFHSFLPEIQSSSPQKASI